MVKLKRSRTFRKFRKAKSTMQKYRRKSNKRQFRKYKKSNYLTKKRRKILYGGFNKGDKVRVKKNRGKNVEIGYVIGVGWTVADMYGRGHTGWVVYIPNPSYKTAKSWRAAEDEYVLAHENELEAA